MRDVKHGGDEGQCIQQSGKAHKNGKSPLRQDSNRQAAGDSTGQYEPSTIDGDVDKYFCPGSGGRTYPHRKFDDKETQGSERIERTRTGWGGG